MDKTWSCGPYDEDWVVIVHAPTRAEARAKVHGAVSELDDWINIRAVRLPELDEKIITKELLIETGFPETFDGEPMEASYYLWACKCEVCEESRAIVVG